ncbi:MAG: DUF58 domain-containing protein [Lachnospiraceae bacterium]|nr:DUF58 domain-containing protein [Lachnospiraceae bacterium]
MERRMKKAAIIKGIINYIFAMIFAIIFGLFLDANVGWFILVTLVLAPLLSVFFAWAAARTITISCEMEEALLSKGDTCNMVIRVANRFIFPTPPIAIGLTNEAGVRSENKDILVSVLPGGSQTFEVKFKAKICGCSMVGIENIKVTDYLGLFAIGVKGLNYESLRKKVAVIPDIAELSARDDNLLKVMQTSLHMDDGEDTMDSHGFAFGGFPGYDNREYVPGDPLKRINWKQSAKRNKLLVRLDDEMAARAIHVVLDSVFEKHKVNVEQAARMHQYRDLAEDEILPKIAEDAVENALGMMQVLLRHDYSVNFYVRMGQEFQCFDIQDEVDLEEVRLELAHYSFSSGAGVPRIPEEAGFAEKVGLFSTPNSYEEACRVLEAADMTGYTTVYAVLEEAGKLNQGEGSISLRIETEKIEKTTVKGFLTNLIKGAAVPYLLGLLLSTIVFSIFGIPLVSSWTVGQILVCAIVVIYCEAVKDHKLIATLATTLIVLVLLGWFARLALGQGAMEYMHWFMSAGDSVETTTSYLMSLLVVFTPFFATCSFYFARVLYRTSFLMLLSLIPFVLYVKVMLPFKLPQLVFVTVLNIAAFLVHYRTIRDKGKRIVGYTVGMLSLGIYATIFVLVGLAVPEAETKYYYMFENTFLGGNITERVPEEFSEMSEHSGNADGFNELNNRKLYVIKLADAGEDLYFNRQTFDFYDFDKDYWYPGEYYSQPVYTRKQWMQNQRHISLSNLIQALNLAESYEPGLLESFGLKNLPKPEGDYRKLYTVETSNFPSAGYVTPPGTMDLAVIENGELDEIFTYVTRAGIYQRNTGLLDPFLKYSVEYYDEGTLRNRFLAAGGANFSREESMAMLEKIRSVLAEHGETDMAERMKVFLQQAADAAVYQMICAENTLAIPEAVADLAGEITKDCTYDWQKAEALQSYFMQNGFVYDLSYKAPDDSVEYFLFEGKTGTCSDYASAYVLMARSVGLTVRYVEGFVPEMEYNGDYVIRTDCGHAYPEVYIENVGYVVYEATIPAIYNTSYRQRSGLIAYLLAVAVRIAGVFVAVSAVLMVIIFGHRIAGPFVKEQVFLIRVRRANPKQAVIMLYRRLQNVHTKERIQNAAYFTPHEYAGELEKAYERDYEDLRFLMEKVAYTGEETAATDKENALQMYKKMLEYLKQWKKNQKKK